MTLLYSSQRGFLPPWQKGGDMARAANRLSFAQAGTAKPAFKVHQRVRIYYHEQRTWLTEEIQYVEISIYPFKGTRYRFNFFYNRRRITLWATQDQLLAWNPPPAPKTATPHRSKVLAMKDTARDALALYSRRFDFAALHRMNDFYAAVAQAEYQSWRIQESHKKFKAFMASLQPIPVVKMIEVDWEWGELVGLARVA